ncbi:MAG: exodeoxyribonuclease VII large subunit [Rhodospirillales bacterium]|nr:exodeoxyribonuclease VII large subunit [Rhodospirillales bacterium]
MPVVSVADISRAIKGALEGAFARVRVRGEISGFKRAASGHLYFTLKDADAVLDAVCWRGGAGRLGLAPEDGMEVVATGRITAYAGRSKYQIVVEALELAGEGALLKLLEERRRKLAAEGLFDEERKKPLPFLPVVVGVVTSPTGAVIRDILHRLGDRFPRHVLLWPVLVQGKGAAEQIAEAIEGFNQLGDAATPPRPDVIIVARGGGSLEDLWAFNEEVVVRAVVASAIPLISAVGHETDTTLIDFAADHRAPTPSAAAEIAVPVRIELLAQVLDDGSRLIGAVNRRLRELSTQLEGARRGLPNLGRLVEGFLQRLDDWNERLVKGLGTSLEGRRAALGALVAHIPHPRAELRHARSQIDHVTRALEPAVRSILHDGRNRLEHAAELLRSTSYQRVLERGFVLVRDAADSPVTKRRGLKPGMDLMLHFRDGDAGVTVRNGGTRKAPKGRTAKRPTDDDQGSLL